MNVTGDELMFVTGSSVIVLNFKPPSLELKLEISLPSDGTGAATYNFKGRKSCIVGISSDSKKIGVCTDKKELKIFKLSDSELLEYFSVPVVKRPSKIIFHDSSDTVIIIDKAGDGYTVSAGSKKSSLLLGHTSMLFDVALICDNKYILTADRDEKIRVSHYPNAYNIHGYCMGHTEFVTSICIIPGLSDMFFTGSGDGMIRLWNCQTCEPVQAHSCAEDLGKLEHDRVVVKTLEAFNNNLVAVTEKPNAVLVYSFSGIATGSASIKLVSKTEFLTKVVRTAVVKDSLLVLTMSEEEPIQRFLLLEGSLTKAELLISKDLLPKIKETAELLYQDYSEFYHKRFDNTSEYQQRKEDRIIGKRKEGAADADLCDDSKRLKSD